MIAIAAPRESLRTVLAVREFRGMCLAEIMSLAGDQFARVALSILVYSRTGSAALTGLTYMLTYVASVVGAFTLSGMADRLPRREVMVVTDALRAVISAVVVVQGIPFVWLCVLISAGSLLSGPNKAAQLVLLRDVLGRHRYALGMTLRQGLAQAAQLIGVATGGVLSVAFSPQLCLLVDAATFAASALVTWYFVRSRPVSRPARTDGPMIIGGLRILWREPRRRAIFVATLLGVFYVAPEGLAAPFVAEIRGDPVMVGFVLASPGIGAVLCIPLISRGLGRLNRRGSRAFPILLLATGVPQIFVLLGGGILPAMLFFAVGGALWSAQVIVASAQLAELLPAGHRAEGMGIAGSMNTTAIGVGSGLAGVTAQVLTPTLAIAVAGVAGLLAASWPAALWIRSTRDRAGSQA